MTDTCYREPTNGVHFVRNAHRPDCTDPDCRGCRPCAEPRHCTARRNCTWHVSEGELTCGRCLAAVRRDLQTIVELAPLALVEAQGDGVNSEAANMAGPAADPEAWSWRKATAKAGGRWHVSLIETDDEHHPYTVLGTWDMLIREDYQHPSDTPVTIANAAAYLDRMLHRIAHDENQDFPLLARELRKCRQHLETVLHNDDRPVRGAPCPSCSSPERGLGPRLVRHYSHWCDDDDCERLHPSDDSEDEWICPRDRTHVWTQSAYERYVEERRSA